MAIFKWGESMSDNDQQQSDLQTANLAIMYLEERRSNGMPIVIPSLGVVIGKKGAEEESVVPSNSTS